uniref:Chitin-binding type-2 domain-containing protein n=1 Tax=Anopheles maculatus TaxID=74869 RepID=A0A182SM17_9DIPT
MTKRTTVGIVIIMLHLLQRCSATDVTTTVVMSEGASTSGSVTPSTTQQSNSTNSTTFGVSEYSETYVQNGDPQVSTRAVSSTSATAAAEGSEHVANTSPTQETSTNPSLVANENGTSSAQNTTTGSDSHPATLFPIQNDTTPYNKSSDALVSSSKVNMTDGSETMDKSEVDTDARGSIAEKEVANTNETETQPKTTNEEAQIEKKDELTRAGINIGEADVRDDDAEDSVEFSETLNTAKSDQNVEKNDTSYQNSTIDQTPKEMDGFEVLLLADDMMEEVVQDDSSPSVVNADPPEPTTEGLKMSPNNITESTTKKTEDTSSPDIGNVANTQSAYGTSFNETEQQTNATQGESQQSSKDIVEAPPNGDNGTTFMQDNANLFPIFNLPSFEAPNSDLGNENKQTTSNDTAELDRDSNTPAVASDIRNASNVDDTPTYGASASNIPQSFDGFQEVQLLAADISLDEPEDQSADEHKTVTNNQNIASDLNPIDESSVDKESNTNQSKLSDADGIISECNTSICEQPYNQTTFNNNTDDIQNDPTNMANLQDTAVGTPSSDGSQSHQVNENKSPALDSTVGNKQGQTSTNDSVEPNAPSKVPDDVSSKQDPDQEPKSISISEVSEDGAGNPLPRDETQTLQNSQSMQQEKQITTQSKQVNNTYEVPPGAVLKIHIENGEITSVSRDTQPAQEPGSIVANENDQQLNETAKEEEFYELLADDFAFGEDDNKTGGGYRPIEADPEDSYITTTTFKPYFISESYETKPPSAGCPFSSKTSTDTKIPKDEQQRTGKQRPEEDHFVEDPYYYGLDPFCLTRHHVLIPAIPVMLPQWCFVPDTPDFMCPSYDLGFHIAFAHETHRDMYYRCVYGQAVLLKCPNLHYWDDERKICTLMADFSHFQRHHSHRPQNLYDQATHHHCQQCRRNFLRPQDLDPAAQCSDRMLLACNTDGTLSVYECPGFYYYDRHIQLRWYADLERCDYPADRDGPWSR